MTRQFHVAHFQVWATLATCLQQIFKWIHVPYIRRIAVDGLLKLLFPRPASNASPGTASHASRSCCHIVTTLSSRSTEVRTAMIQENMQAGVTKWELINKMTEHLEKRSKTPDCWYLQAALRYGALATSLTNVPMCAGLSSLQTPILNGSRKHGVFLRSTSQSWVFLQKTT